MSEAILELMYSDQISIISYGTEETKLEHENDVAQQVYEYIEKTFVQTSVQIELVKIHLLSYINQPRIPLNIQSKKWIFNCKSHSPFLIGLISAIPVNSKMIHITVDNGGLGRFATMEQVITAEDLALITCDQNETSPFEHVTNEQLLSFKAKKLDVCSARINEQGINKLLTSVMSLAVAKYSLHVKFNPVSEDPVSEILKSLSHQTLNGKIILKSPSKTASFSCINGTVDFNIRSK